MRVRFELYSAHLPGTETVNIYNFFVKYFLFDGHSHWGVKYSGVLFESIRTVLPGFLNAYNYFFLVSSPFRTPDANAQSPNKLINFAGLSCDEV